MKNKIESPAKATFEYFGKAVYVTFYDNINEKVFSRFYKNESIAKAQVTKFFNRLSKQLYD